MPSFFYNNIFTLETYMNHKSKLFFIALCAVAINKYSFGDTTNSISAQSVTSPKAYLATLGNNVIVCDINGSQLSNCTNYPLPGSATWTEGIAFNGNDAYITNNDVMMRTGKYDILKCSNANFSNSSCSPVVNGSPMSAGGIAIADNHAIVLTDAGTMQYTEYTINADGAFSNPVVNTQYNSFTTYGITTYNGNFYMAGGVTENQPVGYTVCSISNPSSCLSALPISQVGSTTALSANAYSIAIANGSAYITGNTKNSSYIYQCPINTSGLFKGLFSSCNVTPINAQYAGENFTGIAIYNNTVYMMDSNLVGKYLACNIETDGEITPGSCEFYTLSVNNPSTLKFIQTAGIAIH